MKSFNKFEKHQLSHQQLSTLRGGCEGENCKEDKSDKKAGDREKTFLEKLLAAIRPD